MTDTSLDILIRARDDATSSINSVRNAGRSLDSTLTRTSAGASRFGATASRALSGVSRVAKTTAIVGGAAMIGLGVKGVAAASDLAESQSKVKVVFGESAAEIEKFASTASTKLGMSQQQALEATGTFGNLFDSMGLAEDTTKEFSTGLVSLSADLASFNNMDPTEVLEKLRAGMTGEAEPLKVLGVNMNETTLKAKAMEMGLAGANDTLDAGQKAQAAYALIMEQTTNAQGDFARTSDGMANQQRILSATFTDTMAKIGNAILPVMTRIMPVLTGVLDTLEPVLTQFAGAIAAVLESLVPVIEPLLGVIVQLAATFAEILAPVFETLVPIVAQFAKVIGEAMGPVLEALKPVAGALATAFGAILKALIPLVKPLADILVALAPLITLFADLIAEAAPLITDILQPITELIAALVKVILPPVKGAFKAAFGFIKGMIEPVLDAVLGLIETIKDAVEWLAELQAANKLANQQQQSEASKLFALLADPKVSQDVKAWARQRLHDEGVPGFAGGGIIKSTPGGKIVRVAEGGQNEAIVRQGEAFVGSGGGGGIGGGAPLRFVVDLPGIGPLTGYIDRRAAAIAAAAATDYAGSPR